MKFEISISRIKRKFRFAFTEQPLILETSANTSLRIEGLKIISVDDEASIWSNGRNGYFADRATLAEVRLTATRGLCRLRSSSGLNLTILETDYAWNLRIEHHQLWQHEIGGSMVRKEIDEKSAITHKQLHYQWWSDIVIQGGVENVNRAIDDLTFMPDRSWNGTES
eukprot:837708-Ditylum_brightwellii.AAC.1